MKIPETQEEFKAIERRQRKNIDGLRTALQRARLNFEKACDEYADWLRQCRDEGYQ